jgi:hypothetical protein
VIGGSIAAAGAAVALSVGLATGGGAIGATGPTPSATSAAALSSRHTAQPEPIVRGSIVAANGASAGPVTGGTVVSVSGADLGTVASVDFGDNAGKVVSVTDKRVTITTPAATGFSTGTVAVTLFDVNGKTVPVVVPAPRAAGSATASVAITPLSFSYLPDPRIAAQMKYALAHWQDYASGSYGRIPGNDCVNFTSQTLIARGWTMDAGWSFNAATFQYSPAWSSSTAFAAYLSAHPERATALTDSQRELVKVGDIVQFDWDRTGDRDHTGVVTRVVKTAGSVRIYYAAHTLDTDFKSVDESLANTGGTVSYWSVA